MAEQDTTIHKQFDSEDLYLMTISTCIPKC